MDPGIPPDTLVLPGQCFTLREQVSTWGLPGLRRGQHVVQLEVASV